MDGVIFVEIVDRRGNVVRRDRLEQLPFQIGRSLANAVVIDDLHVSPTHARVELDDLGQLVIRDLGSENGLFAAHSSKRRQSLPVRAGTSIRVGRTLLRFRTLSEEIAPTIIEPEMRALTEWFTTHWSVSIALFIAVSAAASWRSHALTWADVSVAQSLIQPATAVFEVLVWAGAWATAARFLQHEARLGANWAVSCGLFLGKLLIDWAIGFAAFLNAPIRALQFVDPLCEMALLGTGVYLQMGIAGLRGRVRRALIAGLVAAGAVGIFGTGDLTNPPNWKNQLPYWSSLSQIDPSLLPTRTAGEFFRDAEKLRGKLDDLAEHQAQ